MKTDDVRERMGAYKRYSDVPDERRLERFAGSYTDRDVWEEYVASEERSENKRYRLGLTGERWKEHMAAVGRHHALADPDHVEEWARDLLDDLSMVTAHTHYWTPLNGFYRWLLWHTRHPHVYSPVWMAVVEHADGASGAFWAEGRDVVHDIQRRLK